MAAPYHEIKISAGTVEINDGMVLSAGRDLTSTTVTDFNLVGRYQHNDRREEIAIDQTVHGTGMECNDPLKPCSRHTELTNLRDSFAGSR
jgi:hypothetical protein